MGASGDEHELTWLALTLPNDAATVPLDATIVGLPFPIPASPLPHISVRESAESGVAAPVPIVGPDLVVVRLLGEGGMGRVQLARQRSLDREVALKRPRSGASDWDAQLLRAEALVTGHLEHPNIIPVHALGVDDAGQPVIVMKRIEGVSWRDLLHDPAHPGWAAREPDPDARQVFHLQIISQLCNAIAFAHSRGFIHRDMKPGNVMVGEFGEVYLIDWGVAVKTGALARNDLDNPVLVGTPAYMAPEMVRGGPIDERTDVYLLGATLHEVLTGEVRHDGDSLRAVALQAITSPPFRYGDEVPAELAELANLATSADPAARPPGALAFRQAVLDHLRHRGSLRLSADADRDLDAIEGAREPGPIERALEECRFRYRAALSEWPENPDARRGLERCALATARLELRRGNAAAVRAALAGLPSPPAELVAALGRLEADLVADHAERDRLRRLAHDADPTVGAPARVLMFSMLIVLASSVAVYTILLRRTGGIGAAVLIAFPALLAVSSAVFLVLTRRQLAVNAFNRRLAGWLCVLLILLLASRVIGQSTGIALSHQFAYDGLLLGGMFAAGALFLFRWLWVCTALMLASSVVAALVPRVAHLAFEVAAAIVIVIAAALVQRRPSGG